MAPARPTIEEVDGTADNPDTVHIPQPQGVNLQPRGARAARRIYKAMGVWPWDIVPESPPKMWAINLLEDLALVADHVARNPDDTLEDLQIELRRSLARDRKPSYAGKLMAQDVQAAKKRFVRTTGRSSSQDAQPSNQRVSEEPPPSERRSVRRRRPKYGAPDSGDDLSSVSDSEENMASSITVASEFPPSPPMPRGVKALKRPNTAIPSPIEKRIRHSSPEGSRLSAAQSLMMFSSPMATFQMASSYGVNPITNAMRTLRSENLYETIQPAANNYLSALNGYVDTIRTSLSTVQKDIYPQRSKQQETLIRVRDCQDRVAAMEDEVSDAQKRHQQLVEERTAEEELTPQLHALQGHRSLPREITEAIRLYDIQRAAKSEEVKAQERVIDGKVDELRRAQDELEGATSISETLEADIQDLQGALGRGTEAIRLAKMFSVLVQCGPEGLGELERIYPDVGSYLDSMLASRRIQSLSQAQDRKADVNGM